MRAAAASAAVATSARCEVELARSDRADSREIDVRVDGAEHGAQRHENDENDRADEHFAFYACQLSDMRAKRTVYLSLVTT